MNVHLVIVDDDFYCPNCGAPEVDTSVTWKDREGKPYHPFLLRMFKVDNDSHCTRCGCWFDLDGKIVEGPTHEVAPWQPGSEVQKRTT